MLALDFSLRRRRVDLPEIGSGQFDIDRSKVFLVKRAVIEFWSVFFWSNDPWQA
jgi:hypothetical protein